MRTKLQFWWIAWMAGFWGLNAQTTPDSAALSRDSFVFVADTLAPVAQTFKLSKDSLDAPIEYDARDSMFYDIINRRIHLFGAAVVKYTTITLKADYIIFDWETSTVTAEGALDSVGQLRGIPEFQDGEEKFKSRQLKYNFKTRKGIIYNAASQQNDVYVLSDRAKFIAKATDLDSTRTNDVIYSSNAIFTSCDLPTPHYGIRSKKQKVVPNKTVVVGPSNLEIAGVPTPLWLPFGFFPITSKATAGITLPNDYGWDERYGMGFRGLGFFTPINKHLDLWLKGDVYFKGLWAVSADSRYDKKYKYSGNVHFKYSSIPTEQADASITRSTPIEFSWRHNQDGRAHPSINFGGSVNIQTDNFNRNYERSASRVLNSSFQSGMNFSYFPEGRPWNLSASFDHSQNTQSREMTITFPNLNFQMQRIAPFKRKIATGPQKWYEKFGFRYDASARNKLETYDSTLFKENIWDKLQYGVQQNLGADMNFNFLKYFRFSPNARYSETWYFQTQQRTFDPTTIITPTDTIYNPINPGEIDRIVYDTMFGRQMVDTLKGFKAYRNFGMGASLSFDIFGTMLFKKGTLRGLRHYAKPSFSFNYSPNFKDPKYGYVDYVDTDNRPERNIRQEYSVFLGNGVYGSPFPSGKQAALSYSLSNLFQGKYLSKKDSTIKYFNFFDDINLGGSYNFAADSFQWSRVNFSARARWFRDFLNININAQFDPYSYDEKGNRTKELSWKKNRRPLEFIGASLPFTNTITVGRLRDWINGKAQADETQTGGTTVQKPVEDEGAGDFWSVFDNFSLSHNISFDLMRTRAGKDTFLIGRNTLQLRGDIPITKNWRISVGNISYDFKNEQLVYPSLSFYRDLHCWEMYLSWYPEAGAYTFTLKVKDGTLGFLEVPYQRGAVGSFPGF